MTKPTDTPKQQDPLLAPVLTPAPTSLSLQIPANVAYAVQYQAGMFLTADVMNTQESYFVNWLQLQNQLLYTPGVLNGLAVSKTGPNSLSVQTGAGFDSQGDFLILPGNDDGQPATIPSNPPTQDYKLYLVYPDPSKPPPVQGNVVNMASTLLVQDAGATDPDRSVVLAKISVTEGAINSITDLRSAVTSRLPANVTLQSSTAAMTATTAMARSASPRGFLSGTVLVPGTGLRELGNTVQQVVDFNAPPGTFTQIPHVVVTVLGTLPYASAVLKVDTLQFTLALTCVIAPAAYNIEPICVQWLAYV